MKHPISIAVGLLALWILGMWYHIGGSYVHILPLIAMILVIAKVVAGRPGEL